MYNRDLGLLKAELEKFCLKDRQSGPVVCLQKRRSLSTSQTHLEGEELSDEHCSGPSHIFLDFEATQAKIFFPLFARAKIKGYFFHFC